MLGKPGIVVLVQDNFFFTIFTKYTNGGKFFLLTRKMSFNTESLEPKRGAGCIGFGKITFSEAEIINSVEQIGLAGSVRAAKPNDPFGKIKGSVGIVFKPGK